MFPSALLIIVSAMSPGQSDDRWRDLALDFGQTFKKHSKNSFPLREHVDRVWECHRKGDRACVLREARVLLQMDSSDRTKPTWILLAYTLLAERRCFEAELEIELLPPSAASEQMERKIASVRAAITRAEMENQCDLLSDNQKRLLRRIVSAEAFLRLRDLTGAHAELWPCPEEKACHVLDDPDAKKLCARMNLLAALYLSKRGCVDDARERLALISAPPKDFEPWPVLMATCSLNGGFSHKKTRVTCKLNDSCDSATRDH